MKRAVLSAGCIVVLSISAYAGNFFDEFRNQLQSAAGSVIQARLDSLSKDIGAVIGGGSFHAGKNLGFPGFDVGVHVPFKAIRSDNAVVKAAGVDAIAFPAAQIEIGLPMKIDLIGRFMSYGGASLTGYGLRYGIFHGILPLIPSISVQAVMNQLTVSADANKFSATNTSVSALASFAIPLVNPYIGLTMDQNKIEPDASITTLSGTSSGMRIDAGVNLSVLPMTYLQLGGFSASDEIGYVAGLGIKF